MNIVDKTTIPTINISSTKNIPVINVDNNKNIPTINTGFGTYDPNVKADKVSNATDKEIALLNIYGNLTKSGYTLTTFKNEILGEISIIVKQFVASENISANALVYIGEDGKAYNADCALNRRVMGYTKVSAIQGNNIEVYFNGLMEIPSGILSIGQEIYLGRYGSISLDAPNITGYLSQEIGVADTTKEFEFNPQQPLQLV